MGGRRSARLHRIGPRVVAHAPDPHRDPGASRTRREAARLGFDTAQLHLAQAGAPLGSVDDRDGRAVRLRPSGRRCGAHRCKGGRHTPLRGRDGSDARRPRFLTAQGRRVRGRRRARRPRHPAVTPRTDRCQVGCASRRGSRARPRGLGGGQELHAGVAHGRQLDPSRPAGDTSEGPGSEGGPRIRAGSAVTRERAVRLPAEPDQRGRIRDPRQGGPTASASGRRASARGARRRGARGRGRLALHRSLPRDARRTRRGSRCGKG